MSPFALLPAAASVPAQVNPETQACGPAGQRSWLCSTVFDLSDNRRGAEIADSFAKPVRVVIIPLIAGAGVLGIALGFGAQSLVRDFLSGFFMLVEDQYGVGDVIDVGGTVGGNPGGVTGTVEGVSLRTTRIRDVEGVVWHVPNGEIKRVGNKSQQWSRALLDIEIDRDSDIAQAINVIKQTADSMWHDGGWRDDILDEPDVWGVEELSAQSVKIRLVVQTLPLQQWRVARELRARIKAAFDEAGIETPRETITYRRGEDPPPAAGDSGGDG